MTTQQQTERERLADDLEKICAGEWVEGADAKFRRIAALLRGDEPAKPDRYVEIWQEAFKAWDGLYCANDRAAAAVLRKHFPEAEQEVVPYDVAESWKARADNLKEDRENFLSGLAIMMSKHVENWPEPKRFSTAIALLDKTLTEALAKHFPERPAVVVPEDVLAWARSIDASGAGFIIATPVETAARFILSLDGAKGGE